MKKLKTFTATLALLSPLLTSAPSHANAYGYYSPYNYTAAPSLPQVQASPAELLEQGVRYLQAYLAQNPKGTQAVIPFLEQNIAPFFDFAQMSRWILGYRYQRLDNTQKYLFESKLKSQFFQAFSRIISGYGSSTKIEFMQPRSKGYNEVMVSARVFVEGQSIPIRIDFRFVRGPLGWRIYDVGTNGSSAVSYYRSYYRSLIRSKGEAVLFTNP